MFNENFYMKETSMEAKGSDRMSENPQNKESEQENKAKEPELC